MKRPPAAAETMECGFCGAPGSSRFCCRLCSLLAAQDDLSFSRRRSELLRVPLSECPNWTREMRSYLLAAKAWTHRVEPCPTDYGRVKPRRVR